MWSELESVNKDRDLSEATRLKPPIDGKSILKKRATQTFKQAPSGYRLYRHYNAAGDLLYVGISINSFARLAQHRDHSAWFAEIKRVEFESFETKEAVLEAERNAIQKEQPAHNVNHKKLKPIPGPRGRPPKILDVDLEPSTDAVSASRHRFVQQFRPLYSFNEAAAALDLTPTVFKRLIGDGGINTIELQNGRYLRQYITGWQLIEFLERKDLEAATSRK